MKEKHPYMPEFIHESLSRYEKWEDLGEMLAPAHFSDQSGKHGSLGLSPRHNK